MRLEKCTNGHFYDADKYQSCPHCAGGGVGVTMPVLGAEREDSPTVMDSAAFKPAAIDSVGATVPLEGLENPFSPKEIKPDDDSHTLNFWDLQKLNNPEKPSEPAAHGSKHFEPVVGWFVCIKGSHLGEDFRIVSGRNYIGRDQDMDICLSGDNTVSRKKHAVVIYSPKDNLYFAAPGDSKELFYVDGQLVINSIELKRGSLLQIGDVELRFVPYCDEQFSWIR